MASNVKRINIVLDLICFILVFIVFLVIKITLYTTAEGLYPTKTEFLCGDTSIQKTKKISSVGFEVYHYRLSLSFIFPLVVILIVEGCKKMTRSDEDQGEEEEQSCGPMTLKPRPWITSMISLMFFFIFGGFVNEIITDLSKVTVGRLRPSFGSVCKANVTQAACQQGYVTSDVCTGDPYAVKIAQLGFPSGHSSISMYGMLFLAFYIQSAVRTEAKLLKPLLQIVLVSLSLFIGLSRINDNQHFMSDVFAGFLLGATIAWLMAFKVLKLFAIPTRKPKKYTLLPQQGQTSINEAE
ncbi:phospholipid phosphatase 3-like [Oculina patagonica]